MITSSSRLRYKVGLRTRTARKYLNIALLLSMLIWLGGSMPTTTDSETRDGVALYSLGALPKAYLYALIIISSYLSLSFWPSLKSRWIGAADWIVLLCFAGLSTLWSIEPRTTLFATGALVALFFATSYLALVVTVPIFTKALAYFVLIVVIVSGIIALASPNLGQMTTPKFAGQLRGIYDHKNLLADNLVVPIVWLMGAMYARIVSARLSLLAIGLGIGAVIWAWSVTSVVVLIACSILLAIFGAVRPLRLGGTVMVIGTLAGLAVAFWFAVYMTPTILALFDKDLTLTGRDEVWNSYLQLAQRRSVQGYGLGAVQATEHISGLVIWDYSGTRPSPHNSYLSLYVDLGFIGPLIYIFALTRMTVQGVFRFGRSDRVAILNVLVPFAIALSNFTEAFGGLRLSISLLALFYLAMASYSAAWKTALPRK